MNSYDVVIGATRHEIQIPIVDATGTPVDLTASTVRLMGQSLDLPGRQIAYPGYVADGPKGLSGFKSAGSLLSLSSLGAKQSARFICRVQFDDASGTDYTEPFTLRFVRPDLGSPIIMGNPFAGLFPQVHRFNSFTVAPRQVRSTLPTGFVAALDGPAFFFANNAASLHVNKMIEWLLEGMAHDVPILSATGGQTVESFAHELDLCMWADMVDPTTFSNDATAWTLAVGSYSSSTWPQSKSPTMANGGGYLHVRQFLKSRSWELFACLGDGSLGTTKTFTIPEGELPPRTFGGHRVRLYFDLRRGEIEANVDGQLRASLSRAAGDMVPSSIEVGSSQGELFTVNLGFGTQTAPSLVDMAISGFRCSVDFSGNERA